MRFESLVYLYGEAAIRPERRRLADVRRGQYEAIRDEIGTDPARAPDFDPREPTRAAAPWPSACASR